MENKIHLLHDMINYAPNPIAVYRTEEMLIETANPAMIRAWGKGDLVIGKKLTEVLPEIKKQKIFDQISEVFSTGRPFHAKDVKVELEIQGKIKSFYFNYSFIPLFDQKGEMYGIMDTGLDVTDLHDAHLQKQLSDERLRIAIDASGMGTYEINLSTKEVKTSGNFNILWGIDDLPITNEILLKKMHPDDLEVRKKAHNAARKTGNLSYEARIIHPQGPRWIKVNAKIIKDSNGIPISIIGITQDIHNEKQFAGELQKQVALRTEELKRSNEDLLHFAHLVSHDLQEPLRKIKFFNGLMKSKEDILSEKQQHYCQKINRSAERMQILIDGILSYSSLDSSLQPIEKISLNTIVDHVITDLELIIEDKKAVIKVDKLPQIEGASILIHQLLYNLVQNSLKFSKPGTAPEITITAAETNSYVRLNIHDNGIGLDPLYTDKIFNAFERLHSKDDYEGNGLGLSLCRKIVLRHHGTIKACGELGAGTEFIVSLPLKQEAGRI